ncbi:MAG: class I SAM-dependent methyltransferase [Actinomycetia bacterium]|nr:class I SAM-dependent methyltransferase [Actinomycetes bacterium]MCH9801281.1 class I SAM-dependent methyltransferase [Actinomycetes bacterium]
MAVDWQRYLTRYHHDHPGITERVLARSSNGANRNPYQWLIEALPVAPTTVVDLGAGSMPLRPTLPVTTRYLGIDRSPAELQRGRSIGRRVAVAADMSHLPVGSGAVDVVVSSMALMLAERLDLVMAEIARVLRPSGVLAMMLPTPWPLRISDIEPLVRLSIPLRGPGAMPQVVSVSRIRRELAEAGLVVTDVARERFGFRLLQPADAALAVSALYTPGRSQAAKDRAVASLCRLRIGTELPVPLLRVVAQRR